MPTNNYLYPAVIDCTFNNSYTRTDCPPLRRDCIPMDFSCIWIESPDDSYGCTKCGSDEDFCVPYVLGDFIYFQTQLFDSTNPIPFNPVFGWNGDTVTAAFRAQLLDVDGNVLTSDITDFASSYMVAHSPIGSDLTGGFSYQQFIVDTALIKATYGVECWSLRVNSFVDSGGGQVENRVVYSEPYCEVKCDDGTVKVNGEFDDLDCCGNYYALPNEISQFTFSSVGNAVFQFDNTQRYYAFLIQTGFGVTKESFDNEVTRSTRVSAWELQLTKPIPPYMANIFTNQHFAARKVFIDDVEYLAAGTIENRLDSRNTRMFLFDADFTQECDNSFNCI